MEIQILRQIVLKRNNCCGNIQDTPTQSDIKFVQERYFMYKTSQEHDEIQNWPRCKTG